MKRIPSFLALLGAVILAGWCVSAQEPPKPETATIPALELQVKVLKEQIRQLQNSNTICAAQLAIAQEPQHAQAARGSIAQAAKALHCPGDVDVTADPPMCLPVKEAESTDTKPLTRGRGGKP